MTYIIANITIAGDRTELKKREVNRILRHTLAKGFAIANHKHEMCLKKGKFCDEDQKSDSQITLKKVFLRKVIPNYLKVIRNIANQFGKVIRSYPKSNSHFAM